MGRLALVSELREACLRLPRIYSPREVQHLETFEAFRAGGAEPSVRALRLGLEQLFRRGQYLQMHELAKRITVRDLELDTFLSVAEQAVEQSATK